MTKQYVINKTFDNRCAKIKRNGNTLVKDIQLGAEEALEYMENKENCTTALNLLYNSLPNAIRKKDFIKWVSLYMPVYFTKKKSKAGAVIYTFKHDKKDAAVAYDSHGMKQNLFNDYVKERTKKELEDMTEQEIDAMVINYLEVKKKRYENAGNAKVAKILDHKIKALAA